MTRLIPPALDETIVAATKAHLAAGVITPDAAIAEIRSVMPFGTCTPYGARIILGIEFDPGFSVGD